MDKTVEEVMDDEAVFDHADRSAKAWRLDAMNYTDPKRKQLRLDHADRLDKLAMSVLEANV